MKSGVHGKFNEIVKSFLGTELPESLAGRVDFEALPHEARDVIRRMLALMKRSGSAGEGRTVSITSPGN